MNRIDTVLSESICLCVGLSMGNSLVVSQSGQAAALSADPDGAVIEPSNGINDVAVQSGHIDGMHLTFRQHVQAAFDGSKPCAMVGIYEESTVVVRGQTGRRGMGYKSAV